MTFVYILMILMIIGAGFVLRVSLTMVFNPIDRRFKHNYTDLTEEEMKEKIKEVKKSGIKGSIGCIITICILVFAIVMLSSLSGNHSTSSESNANVCTICGGELKCAICGEKGLYCENASYGAGTDHYCNKHWGDCVEWHEKQDNK